MVCEEEERVALELDRSVPEREREGVRTRHSLSEPHIAPCLARAQPVLGLEPLSIKVHKRYLIEERVGSSGREGAQREYHTRLVDGRGWCG